MSKKSEQTKERGFVKVCNPANLDSSFSITFWDTAVHNLQISWHASMLPNPEPGYSALP